jgi:hypothetical protein
MRPSSSLCQYLVGNPFIELIMASSVHSPPLPISPRVREGDDSEPALRHVQDGRREGLGERGTGSRLLDTGLVEQRETLGGEGFSAGLRDSTPMGWGVPLSIWIVSSMIP